MDPTRQGSPLQPVEPSPASSSSKAPKIPIEPGRMQAIKETFEEYKKNWGNGGIFWAQYRILTADQLDPTAVKALSHRIIGAPDTEDGITMIDWLANNDRIHANTDELNTLIENNFREKEPDEVVEPSDVDKKTKAQRREVITAAYQEYMDVDSANPENKIAAFRIFVDKVNKQMTAQEVQSIALAYGAYANISDFKGLTKWLQGRVDPSRSLPMLDGKDPATVKRMMDTIFPSNIL